MAMWLRLAGALLVTALVMAALDYFGVSLGGRSAQEVHHQADNRLRELFWLLIFAFVMAISVVAAARRWAGQLRRAVAPARSQRRDVA